MEKNLRARPPIVTLMGHVDHGKTSLLDAIRKSNITAQEHGQITQHIGAYTVEVSGKKITFLDTPGHEAFTAMRLRGAQVTDIVILVVAVNEGVMPQTIEAVHHCQAAQVPVIVALNKVDKGRDNIPRVKAELAKYNLLTEDLGGQTISVETSAPKGLGIDSLLEAVLLQAEMMELKADYGIPAEGVVIETKLDRGSGPNITLIVLKGILKPKQSLLIGATSGKVRAIYDDHGGYLSEVSPGLAARIIGVEELPAVGAKFRVVSSEKAAREIIEKEKSLVSTPSAVPPRITLEEFYLRLQTKETKELTIVLKADVAGSVEALTESLQKISIPEVNLNLIHAGVGTISESDVLLARSSGSIILGFNVSIDAEAKTALQREKVQVRFYQVIYDLLDDVRKALSGLLAPKMKETLSGKILVKQVFHLSNGHIIAGCSVLEGKVLRGSKARLSRGDKIVWESNISSLRRFKEDVREVAAGYECGVELEGAKDVEAGDIITAFQVEEVVRIL